MPRTRGNDFSRVPMLLYYYEFLFSLSLSLSLTVFPAAALVSARTQYIIKKNEKKKTNIHVYYNIKYTHPVYYYYYGRQSLRFVFLQPPPNSRARALPRPVCGKLKQRLNNIFRGLLSRRDRDFFRSLLHSLTHSLFLFSKSNILL